MQGPIKGMKRQRPSLDGQAHLSMGTKGEACFLDFDFVFFLLAWTHLISKSIISKSHTRKGTGQDGRLERE